MCAPGAYCFRALNFSEDFLKNQELIAYMYGNITEFNKNIGNA